jgi:hypothetical protein
MSRPWWELLTEPKALLGPYGGRPPELGSFAPHALRADLDEISVAGQFMQLPTVLPATWGSGDQARAYAVFQFLGVRRFECEGLLQPSPRDDANHDAPVGQAAECGLVDLAPGPAQGGDRQTAVPWRRFTLRQPGFGLVVEAMAVSLRVGQKAWRSQGWPERA